MIAHNERRYLKPLFKDILNQTFPKEETEIVFVNNKSTDSTKRMMLEFAERYGNLYAGIKVIESPKNLQATAWNEAIMASDGRIIIRVDAHASIPPKFVEENLRTLAHGEYICGGGRPNKAASDSGWSRTLLAAEECIFGSSFASYRKTQKKKMYVKSVFHGAYRREVFAKIGGFDETLGRTEDNELHYRARKAGFKICQSPKIVSYQYIRPSLAKMIKQKYSNGYWIGLTLGVCEGCISYFHLAPLALVLCLIASAVISFFGMMLPLYIITAAYLIFDLLISISAFFGRKKSPLFVLLPLIFPLLHISYGLGTLFGILNIPIFKKKRGKLYLRRINQVKKVAESKL